MRKLQLRWEGIRMNSPRVNIELCAPEGLTAAELAQYWRELAGELHGALKAIIELDDGDKPDLWHFEKEFEAGRSVISKAEGRS
jgi:hypothetical protein